MPGYRRCIHFRETTPKTFHKWSISSVSAITKAKSTCSSEYELENRKAIADQESVSNCF